MRDEKGRFLPGTSGNEYGRPHKKYAVFTEILKELGEIEDVKVRGEKIKRKYALAEQLWKMAIEGDLAAIRLIYDRIDGKPKETIRQVINQIPSYVGFIASDDYLINKSITNESGVKDD